nr:hypothetical protein OG781_26960 [Streptomyces sp. NBC_00830]
MSADTGSGQCPAAVDNRYDGYRAVTHELDLFHRRTRRITTELALQVHPELDPGTFAVLARLCDEPARPSDLAAYFNLGAVVVAHSR